MWYFQTSQENGGKEENNNGHLFIQRLTLQRPELSAADRRYERLLFETSRENLFKRGICVPGSKARMKEQGKLDIGRRRVLKRLDWWLGGDSSARKVMASQAPGPEFNSQNPQREGGREGGGRKGGREEGRGEGSLTGSEMDQPKAPAAKPDGLSSIPQEPHLIEGNIQLLQIALWCLYRCSSHTHTHTFKWDGICL